MPIDIYAHMLLRKIRHPRNLIDVRTEMPTEMSQVVQFILIVIFSAIFVQALSLFFHWKISYYIIYTIGKISCFEDVLENK